MVPRRTLKLARRVVGALPAAVLQWVGRAQFKVPVLRRLTLRWVPRLMAGESTIRHGPARGLRIDPAGAHPGYALGTSEPMLQQALVELLSPGDVFYDLGANVGFFTLLAARLVGAEGLVVAFEPDPRNADVLRSNIARNGLTNVAVFERGVSDAPGPRTLVIAESTASHIADAPLAERTAVIDVVSLDSFTSDEECPPPTVIKIDIEGEEVRALRGAGHLLARCRPVIVCELHGTETEVRQVLTGAGYRLRILEGEDEPLPWNAHVLAMPG